MSAVLAGSTKRTAYYNEIDPYAAAWLRNLIAAGLIAPGDVDERDIRDIRPDDLRGYTQCHFFAGIGGWSRALRLAGWADDRPVWTGSCPCQPFSAAGKGGGFADERHLWPAWFHLVRELRPAIIFGEQVAAKAVEPWIDLVQSDVEALGYAFGGVPVPASGIGAPHIRDRLWWVADAAKQRPPAGTREPGRGYGPGQPERSGVFGGVANAESGRNDGPLRRDQREGLPETVGRGFAGGVADADGRDAGAEREQRGGQHGQQPHDGGASGGVVNAAESGRELRNGRGGGAGVYEGQRGRGVEAGGGCPPDRPADPGPLHGFWRDADWLLCRDGKWRPVESGTFPLAHGVSARVGKLRAAGNAIVPQVAADFIGAWLGAVRSVVSAPDVLIQSTPPANTESLL